MKKLRKAYIALIMAFLYAPIVLLILYSFNDSKSRANWGGFTLRWYKELFSDAAIMSALGTTLSIGLLAAVFSTLLGTVGAIALYQMKRGPRKALLSIVNLPMLNSEVVTGVSLMLLYAMVNIQLGYLTLLLSHIAFCVPYVVLSVMPKLRQLDPNLAEAAQDLGGNKYVVFRKVIFPLSLSGVVSGISMTFMPAVSTFIISRLLGGGQQALIGDIIENQFKVVGNWGLGSAMSVVLMVLILAAMNVMRKYEDENAGGNVLL